MNQEPGRSCVLTINGGSSSLKFAIFERDQAVAGALSRRLSGRIERIGLPDARASVSERAESAPANWKVDAPDLAAAADLVLDWLDAQRAWETIAGVGHRIVHGGPRYASPEMIHADVIAELKHIIPLDVDHLPGELAVIERVQARRPELPQVACFDTAFHHDLPRLAQIVPIPRKFAADGVRRYGFHGLSYAYLMQELARLAGSDQAEGRVVLAHLGSGASVAAVDRGRCVDTTMGFTPASGLVMGTRAGDLDPGLPLYLALRAGMTAREFHAMANHESGLIGVSETSADLRDLLERQDHDIRAAEAIGLFCYQAKKWIGSMAAVLGGVDTLVFSGGIGENSPAARARICEGLGFLGITLDQDRNQASAAVISTDRAAVRVRVIRTDEESMIARETAQRLSLI